MKGRVRDSASKPRCVFSTTKYVFSHMHTHPRLCLLPLSPPPPRSSFLPKHVSVRDIRQADVVETAIPKWLQTAFVVERAEDRQLLMREFVDKGKHITVITAAQNRDFSSQRPIDLKDLDDLGEKRRGENPYCSGWVCGCGCRCVRS